MIRLARVSKAFGGTPVLEDFQLEVATGETVAVVGRSGSGKSVLLKHVARLLRPDAGEVWVGDTEISRVDGEPLNRVRRRMGYVFQFAALFDSLTVGDNIRLALRRMVSQEEVEERLALSLERVGLADVTDRYPAELSGGMRKRAGVARAVAAEPEYLLYDEPTTGLDPVTTSRIDDLMVRLKAELHSTSIVVTHDMTSAFRVADRIALLYGGRIHAQAPPEEFRHSPDPLIRAFVEGRMDLWPGE